MGQQQLLLLVLGIVIVGIAVVAGIQAFSEGKAKAQQDAAVTDATRIISDTQAWKLKPSAFGGGSEKSGFADVNFRALGYPVASKTAVYATTSGCYDITDGTNATVDVYKVVAADTSGATTCGGDQIAKVTISGTDSKDLSWTYQ